MRRQTALPRISREGWVPAGPEKRVNKCAMLIPKTGLTNATIPTLMDFSEVICPAERRALREIVETAEVVREGDHLYAHQRFRASWSMARCTLVPVASTTHISYPCFMWNASS